MGYMYHHIIIKREKIHPIENIFNNSIQIYVKKYSMGCMYHHII